MRNKKLIIIWPTVFREFDYYRLEIAHILKEIDVEIHEMVKIFNLDIEKVYHTRCNRKIIKRFKNFKIWKNYMEKNLYPSKTVVYTFFYCDTYFKFLTINFLNSKGITLIKHSAGGGPRKKINIDLMLHKLINDFSLEKFFFIFKRMFFLKLGNFLFKYDFIIAMTSLDYSRLNKNKSYLEKPIIIKGNSIDYSNALIYKPTFMDKKYKASSYSLLLDTPGPRFIGDELLYKTKNYHTAEKWYPQINKFFYFIEKNFQTKIKIAPHPKTKPPKFPKDFNYREVLFNRLAFSVKNAKIIISKVPGSTALLYAALYKKPIIMVFSNETKAHKSPMEDFHIICRELRAKPINIDENYTKKIISERLKINEKVYKRYVKKFGTARNDKKPNSEIIINLLKKIFKEDRK